VSARRLAGPELERVHSIFCVSRPFLDGGPQKRLFRLARAWAARGHATAIAAMRGDLHAPVEELEELGMPVYLLTDGGKEVLKSFRTEAARSLRGLARELQPRIVFSMETLADYQVRLGLMRTEIPVVTLLGIDRWKWEGAPHRVWLVRRLARHRGAVIGNSRRCLEGWRRVVGADRFERTPHAVIHNPVDPDEFTPVYERDHRDLVVGALGRYEPQKGFDLLLRAFAKLPRSIAGREVKLRLQGRGKEEPNLRALAASLELGERVEFVPFAREIETFLHSLAVLVVPSRWAGFENVALEGMLSGTPTLCSRETGLDELPPDPSLPFFALDESELAAAMARTLELDARGRAALARAQRDLVVRELDMHVIAAKLERFLVDAKVLA
jgi:glycosyltransferase involved in cell wall biosynthesis